jgi:hypothetical protein
VTDINRFIQETHRHIEELRGERKDAIGDNEFSREYGYSETDITQIEGYIQEAEQALKELEQLRDQFLDLAERANEVNEEGKALLEKHHSDKVN